MNEKLQAMVLLGGCAAQALDIQCRDFEAAQGAELKIFFPGSSPAQIQISPNAPTELGQQLWQVFYPIFCQIFEEYHNAMLAQCDELRGQILSD